jgi:hypothetical protein
MTSAKNQKTVDMPNHDKAQKKIIDKPTITVISTKRLKQAMQAKLFQFQS